MGMFATDLLRILLSIDFISATDAAADETTPVKDDGTNVEGGETGAVEGGEADKPIEGAENNVDVKPEEAKPEEPKEGEEKTPLQKYIENHPGRNKPLIACIKCDQTLPDSSESTPKDCCEECCCPNPEEDPCTGTKPVPRPLPC